MYEIHVIPGFTTVSVRVRARACVHACMRVCMYMCAWHVCVCVCVCACVCACVCVSDGYGRTRLSSLSHSPSSSFMLLGGYQQPVYAGVCRVAPWRVCVKKRKRIKKWKKNEK